LSKFVIHGGRRLEGAVDINGSKNSALPILTAAALAAEGTSVLENVPRYTDVLDLCEILRTLGCEVAFVGEETVAISAANLRNHVAPYRLARKLRGSTYLVGLLLARLGRAEVALPGGCDIGTRPVDFHLKGFQALGAEAWVEHGSIHARVDGRLKGATFYVERASFGTTVNLMIAASLARGTTVLENAAREPEIVDLANFLTSMGATVRGAGTNQIRIEGAESLRGARHEVIPDRLEAGTYLLAGLITGGRVTVRSVIPEHLGVVLTKLREAGGELEIGEDTVTLAAPEQIRAVDIQTMPHPGFPTDLQQPFTAALTVADGVSVVQETVFESRFAYTNELLRMGANIKVERDTAIVRGVPELTAAPVEAREIRGGAALVLAGLRARGVTEVLRIRYIERGYQEMDRKLRSLGADVERVEEPD
jgi:UDP-N-acetylglucosamine 1-carboxyvinyltransferase